MNDVGTVAEIAMTDHVRKLSGNDAAATQLLTGTQQVPCAEVSLMVLTVVWSASVLK